MASTCVWFPYRDSACLVLGCVRGCVLAQRLSKGKCIGPILDDRGRLRRPLTARGFEREQECADQLMAELLRVTADGHGGQGNSGPGSKGELAALRSSRPWWRAG
jgi:hypothetical protein